MQQEHRINNNVFELDLLKLVKACWTRLWIIILVAVLAGGAMFVYGKHTYVPQYETSVTMYTRVEQENNLINVSIDKLTGTCLAMLQTRATLEEVSAATELNIPYSKIAAMISAEGIPSSPLFKITVTGNDPEEITMIANTVADILPGMVYSVYSECEVGVVDYALVPTVPSSEESPVKDAALAAVLGALLVCAIIVGKVIYTDWVAFNSSKNSR